MAEDKNNSNFLLDFMSGGNTRNVGLTNDMYDIQEFLHTGEVNLQQQTGAISAEEAAKAIADYKTENDKNRQDAINSVNFQTGVNTVLNSVGFATSVTSGVSAIKAAKATSDLNKATSNLQSVGKKAAENTTKAGLKISKAVSKSGNTVADTIVKGAKDGSKTVKVLSNKGTMAFKSVSKIAKDGTVESITHHASTIGTMKNVGHNVVDSFKGTISSTAGKTGLSKALSVSGNILKNTGKATIQLAKGTVNINGALANQTGAFLGKFTKTAGGNLFANFIGNTAVCAAPSFATQIFTRNISDAKTAELTDTINTLQTAVDYYEDNKNSLTKEQQEFFEATYTQRDKDCADLLNKYADYMNEDGEITDETMKTKYTEEYEKLEKEYADKIDEQTKEWQGYYAGYVTHEGVSNSMSEYMIDKEINPDTVVNNSEFAAEKAAEPGGKEAFDRAREGYAITQDLNDEGFMGFIDKMHDTLVQYLPVFAYAEAAIKKGTDVLLETIMKDGYTEKYATQSIDDLAKAISTDAISDNEKRAQREALEKESGSKAYTSYGDYKAAQEAEKQQESEKQEAEVESGQQSGQETAEPAYC